MIPEREFAVPFPRGPGFGVARHRRTISA